MTALMAKTRKVANPTDAVCAALSGAPEALQAVLAATYRFGAQEATEGRISKARPDITDVQDEAVAWAAERSGELIADLSSSQQDALKPIIARAVQRGWSDTYTAQQVRKLVGLNAQQALAVDNYRSRMLMDGVPPGTAQKRADQYAMRLQRTRAKTIAQNEIRGAYMAGQRQAWRNMRDLGDVSPYAVRIVRTAKDDRRCAVCKPLNGMRTSLVGGTYPVKIGGAVRAMDGPPFHPNCRCIEVLQDLPMGEKPDPHPIQKGVRRVRTLAGSRKYNLPIGAPIVPKPDVPKAPKKGTYVAVAHDPDLVGKEGYELKVRQPSGSPVRGKPIDVMTDVRIPDEVFHVTTNAAAVKKSGYLRASGHGGLGGDKQDTIVSLTISEDDADNIEVSLKRAVSLAHQLDPDPEWDFDRETKQWVTDDMEAARKRKAKIIGVLRKWAEEEDWEFDKTDHLSNAESTDTYGLKDWLTQYFSQRSYVGNIKDPILFTDYETLRAVDPKQIQKLKVPKEALAANGAMVTDFDLGRAPHGLNEVRVYGDVPLGSTVKKDEKMELGDDFAFAHLFKQEPASADVHTDAPIGVMGPNGGLKTKKKPKKKRLVGFKFAHLINPVVVEDVSKAKDGDGDGFVNDGTPRQRPATPAEKKPAAKKTLKKPASRDKERDFSVSDDRLRPGHRAATKEDLDRIQTLAKKKVPPAWTDLQVPEDEDSDNLLVGYDAKGRRQVVQKPEAVERNAAAKFERVRELAKHIPLLDKELDSEVELGVTEAALALIRFGGLRPGSDTDTGAEKKAYGATNMLARHATISEDGKSVHIKMTGKKGVALDLTIEHPTAVKAVQIHLEGKDPDEPLFGTTGARVGKVLKGIVGDEFKVKDLRTYVATSLAYDLVRTQDPPTSQKDFAAKRRSIGKQVSDVLGNTPTMALNSYISPMVFAGWQNAWEDQ